MGKAKVQGKNEKNWKETFWIVVAIISMTVYVVWRIFFTVPDHEIYGWLSTICGAILVTAETVAMLEGAEHFTRLRKKVVPEKPEIPRDWYPHVDILIATHNEDAELLFKTVNGCKHMRYPDQGKVHIFLCDDGNREEIAILARHMNVGYFGMAENKHAKAGNLNNALSQTHSPWVVTFDSDMIPTKEFLMETVPYIYLPYLKKTDEGQWVKRDPEEVDVDYKIGFIQTPQSFYNPDLFQYNFYSETRIPNEQDFFFREVNVGRNSANASIYAGSNTLISREALMDVGGIAINTITEDFETGIHIQEKGYTSYAIDKPLAHGLAPTDIDSLLKQRIRWGRGCIFSMRRVHILLNPHLKWNAKLSYLSCWMYWWTFARRLVYIMSPILFVLFGIPIVICSIKELLFIWLPSYFLYNHALKVTSGKIRNQRWSNIVDTTIFPYMIIPIMMETIHIKEKKFYVTSKTREVGAKSDFQLAIPHILLLAFDLLALFVCVRALVVGRNVGVSILIYWLGLNGVNLIMAVFFMMGRKNMRVNDRFYIKVPVQISYKGKNYYGITDDASETGLSVRTREAVYMPHEEDMTIHLKTETCECEFQGSCVHVVEKSGGWKYGIRITDISEENKGEFLQILYDRDHSLAKQMSASVSVFEDVFLNIHKRAKDTPQGSRRALPRVEVNQMLPKAGGGLVRAVNCNYEYILLESAGPALGKREDIRVPGTAFVLRCVENTAKPGLYYIENWKEILFNGGFDVLFALSGGEEGEEIAEAKPGA